jgi:hypothetical protein
MAVGFDGRPDYWAAIAGSIEAESDRATCYLQHATSIGTAREAILRDLVRRHTPAPYLVQSGFSHHPETRHTTCQCDILVHDPTMARPFFEVADIVVAHRLTVRAAVEVKSTLDKGEWADVLKVHQNFCWQGVPTFGFSFDGVTFDSFLGYLGDAIRDDPYGVPDCVAVHSCNYVFLRSPYIEGLERPGRHRATRHQFAVNFGDQPGFRGMATAAFIDSYLRHLMKDGVHDYFKSWFDGVQLPMGMKVSFADDGQRETPA